MLDRGRAQGHERAGAPVHRRPCRSTTRLRSHTTAYEIRLTERDGRPLEPGPFLRLQPDQAAIAPHDAPSGSYLVGFYVGEAPCDDCEGIRLELSLFEGAPTSTSRTYWLEQTRLGGPDGERTSESTGRWSRRSTRIDVKSSGEQIVRNTELTVLELIGSSPAFNDLVAEDVGGDQLALVELQGRIVPEGRHILARRAAAIPKARWYESLGCTSLGHGASDSSAGSIRCASTVIGYDIGGMAGDRCLEPIATDLAPIGAAPMKMCTKDLATSMTVSIPEHAANLFVEKPTPEDVMVLLRVARHCAERKRAASERHD
jgi:hypothetical protein